MSGVSAGEDSPALKTESFWNFIVKDTDLENCCGEHVFCDLACEPLSHYIVCAVAQPVALPPCRIRTAFVALCSSLSICEGTDLPPTAMGVQGRRYQA